MKRRTRNALWNALGVAAVVGVVYGAFEMIEATGITRGLIYSVGAALLGYLAAEMIYPMWFGR